MYSLLSDEEQRVKLNQLNVELSCHQPNNQRYNEIKRAIDQQIGRQGENIDALRHRGIIENAHRPNECEMCQELQADSRYILVNILNNQEVIKTTVRQISRRLNELEIEEDQNDSAFLFCCTPTFLRR
jgi:hypothetical protein